MDDLRTPMIVDRFGNGRTILFLFTGILVAIFALLLLPREHAAMLAEACLILLAVLGVLAAYAYAAGFLHLNREGAGPQNWQGFLFENYPDGLAIADQHGKILFANTAYLALAGAADGLCDPERLFSKHPKVAQVLYRLAQKARLNGNGSEDVRVVSGDGEKPSRWYRIALHPLGQAPAGRGAGVPLNLWVFSDLTRERESLDDIGREMLRGDAFADHIPAGFFACDRSGKIIGMNAAMAGWLGRKPLSWQQEASAPNGNGARLHAEEAAPLFSPKDASLFLLDDFRGTGGEAREDRFESELKREDGQMLPVILLRRVEFDNGGASIGSWTLVLKREAELTKVPLPDKGEIRYAQVFDTTPIAIAIVDPEGRILRSNAAFARFMPEALKRDDRGEARTVQSAIVERDRALLDDAIHAAREGKGDTAPLDVTLSGPGERSARLFVAGFDAGEGGATIYALDTTELRTLQNNFAQSQKMQAIGQLAGGVAHDFNNVLTAIIGYSDLLLANQRPTDPSFQDIMQIKQNANRAAGLVRQLLAFSRRQTLRPQVIQLGDVLSDLHMLLRRLVGEKIDLDLRHGRDLWLVKADLNQFEQVIVNLVVNARDAMPEGGRISLRTRNIEPQDCTAFSEQSLRPGEYVLIEVEDNGHGIPDDVKDKIFEPFFTTKEVGKGTGLGLAMVYGIVKQTGGTVFCDSTIGIGTTFSILLPRYKEEERSEAPAIETRKPAPDLTGRGTILLVEDEEAVRAFGARALTSRGYTVLQASSGLEALDVAEENADSIDLVVSDVVMPEMDGPTMFGELRKRGIKAKVIFVSGYAEEAFAKNLPEGEDFGFLPKPFSLKQLIEAVKGHMS